VGGGGLKVVDVTQWYSPVSGGIRTYLRAKARWAARNGMSHGAVVTGDAAGDEALARSTFARVRGRTPARRWGYRIAPRAGPVVAALERLAPDVVVLHDALAFPGRIARWARARGLGVAMFCHSDLALGAAGLPSPVRRPAGWALDVLQRRALVAPDLVIVASESSRARLAPRSRAPVVTSALGVDLDALAGARSDPALRAGLAGPGEALLLYAGRLSSEKRIDLLCPALAALERPAVLAVAGAGAAEARLRRDARRLGVAGRVRLLGHLGDRRALATLMATADCFVHPNPAEPFGLAPLEALAAGCRVVAPASAGPAETLRGRGAVLVVPGDAAALAAGIDVALAAPRPRPDLGDLSWDRAFAREWRLYRELAAAA
jgi:alpha-1,6-mannosyltransferase